MVATVDFTKLISPGFTENVLHDILRKKSGFKDVTIREIKLGAPSKKGDSYLSTVMRFTVEANGNDGSGNKNDFQVHVIVKSVPQSLARRKSFRSVDFFANELDFYNKVWPALDAFQKAKNLPELYDSIPLCLASFSDGNSDFIALEDLSYQGYETLDRTVGLDLEMATCIFKNFAKFHAISVAYREQNPSEFEEMADSLQETYFDEKFRTWYTGSMNKFCCVAKDAVQKELPESYLKKMDELISQDLYGNISKLLKKRSTLCAITHGDCWAPNFLVRQSNSTRKIALIDFQLMRAASLTTDILFILCTCVDPKVRDEHWEDILKNYHATFSDVLKELGSKLDVTLELFMEEVRMNGLFGFGMCNEALIMSLMEDDDVADLDAFEGDEGFPLHKIWKIEPIRDNEKRKRVADYLKFLIDNKIV